MALENKYFKIGIVTFFYTNNYGGVLQALSLQKYLKSLGYEVEFINYHPQRSKVNNPLRLQISLFKNKILALLGLNKTAVFNQKFIEFKNKYLKLSKKYNTYIELENEVLKYDFIVTGSDQVWNTRLVKNHLKYFLLDFAKEKKTKTISYAACIGQEEQNKDTMDDFKCLDNLDFISVRNAFSNKFVSQYTNKPVSQVVDPTFLVSLDKYVSEYSLKNKGDFTLVYCLNESLSNLLENVLDQLSNYNSNQIIVLHSKYVMKIKQECIEIFDATPNQWMWFFKNANYVVTDSFHGMVFSIKYNKKFVVLHDNGWRSYRVTELALSLSIEDICIFSEEQVDNINSINLDYKKINKKLKVMKKNSYRFYR